MENVDSSIPIHLGFILDGNRRWARERGLSTLEGHRKGYENLKTIARAAFDKGVKFVSAYCFSTENWSRAQEEVDYLMNLAMNLAVKDAKQLIKENIKIVVMGIEERVPTRLIKAWQDAEEKSKNNTGGTLAICFNYGGQREISDAVKKIVQSAVSVEEVTPELITENLYHPDVPQIDLMVRTSGEQRISNFMLWRMAYAEMYFADVHWPAFTIEKLDQALQVFSQRNRRFGGN